MNPEIILRDDDGEIIRRRATLADLKSFVKDGMLDGKEITRITVELSPKFALEKVEIETEM